MHCPRHKTLRIRLILSAIALLAATPVATGAPPVAGLADAQVSAAEGNTMAGAITFRVVLDAPTPSPESVHWTVTGDTAEATDFPGGVFPSGEIAFAPGETEQQLMVPIQQDRRHEEDESFKLNLSNPSAGLLLGVTSGTGIILNDDLAQAVIADNVDEEINQAEVMFENVAAAQSFHTGDDAIILASVSVLIGAPGNTTAGGTVDLYGDDNGQPGELIEELGAVTGTISSDALELFSVTQPILTSNTRYWVVVRRTSGTLWWWVTFSTNSVGQGRVDDLDRYSPDGGTTWETEEIPNFVHMLTVTGQPTTGTLENRLSILSANPQGTLRYAGKAVNHYELRHTANLVDWTVMKSFLTDSNGIRDLEVELPGEGEFQFFQIRKMP